MNSHRESGQALVFALLILFLVSVACALVAADLSLEQRSMVEEVERAHLRALLDASLADALAHLAVTSGYGGKRENYAGGTIESRVQVLPGAQREISVTASYRNRKAAARATVLLLPHHPPRVTSWARVAASVP